MPARILVLTGAGCSGKTAVGTALKVRHGYAQVSVWKLRLQHLVMWEDRDKGDDYEPGCLIALAACRIYAERGRSSVLEDIGDREAVEAVAGLRGEGLDARLITLVADDALLRERIADRTCAPAEIDWLIGLNRAIAGRPRVPGETRLQSRAIVGRADETAAMLAAP